MSKASCSRVLFAIIILMITVSVPTLANQIPNELQNKSKALQQLRDEVKSEVEALEKSQREVEELIQESGLTPEVKSMIDKNYELSQMIKEKAFEIYKLEIETDQVDYDKKMQISLNTFEVAIKDGARAIEEAPENMKEIITTSANKKQEIYNKYLKLFNEKSKSSKELYFDMHEELNKVNYEVKKYIEDLNLSY